MGGHGLMLCEDCAGYLANVDDAEYLRVFGLELTERKIWKRAAAKAARARAAV